MKSLINIDEYPVADMLQYLLKDKTTKENIILATDQYGAADYPLYSTEQITIALLRSEFVDLQPRVLKSINEQVQRTKKRAEVFTPSWICNRMNNYCDSVWFGYDDVFNQNKIEFPNDKTWQDYVCSKRLEITCGEAPYVVSRYDASNGELIDVENRIGFLDRKIRVINENVSDEEEWFCWVNKAYQNVYGYEYQGDNLLIARINLLWSFVDYVQDKWNRPPTKKELKTITNIIVWNFWQMDGLTGAVPFKKVAEDFCQISWFDNEEKNEDNKNYNCRIYDWTANKSKEYNAIKERKNSMKFDFAIGNPPYQESRETTKDMPVYNAFMDAAFLVADKVELITPGRFLFNAGATPKQWNEKMLNDKNFKVLEYEPISSKIFPNTDIKGGIAITYRDKSKKFGAIETYTAFDELNSIMKKVKTFSDFVSLNTIMYPYSTYTFSEKFWEDFPEKKKEVEYISKNRNSLSKNEKKGKLSNLRIITTNIFDLLTKENWGVDLFFDEIPDDGNDYVCLMGRQNNTRCSKFINAEYINVGENYNKYKIILPAGNGCGALGETLSTPLVGYTQTFLGIGCVDTKDEANAIYKYVCSKFARCMLGILKITQHNPPEKWKYVPLQDFTSTSDIDWTQSVAEVDAQLYKKYGLS